MQAGFQVFFLGAALKWTCTLRVYKCLRHVQCDADAATALCVESLCVCWTLFDMCVLKHCS